MAPECYGSFSLHDVLADVGREHRTIARVPREALRVAHAVGVDHAVEELLRARVDPALPLDRAGLGVALAAAACANRILESWLVGWGIVRDPVALKRPWLYPLRDLLGFFVWAASYLASGAAWRNSNYELKGEKIVLRKSRKEV